MNVSKKVEDLPAPPARIDVPAAQEGARELLAYFFTAIMMIEIIFAMTATWLPAKFGLKNLEMGELKDIMTIVLTPTVALVGSAAGFYFGHQDK